jgi:hypothetical protein
MRMHGRGQVYRKADIRLRASTTDKHILMALCNRGAHYTMPPAAVAFGQS